MNVLDNLTIGFLTSVLSAFATGAITFWGFWRKEKAELEKEYSSRFNSKKWEVYTEFTKLVHEIMGDGPASLTHITGRPTEGSLASQIVLIGSDKVVNAFRVWRETNLAYGQAHVITTEKLFELIAEMRRDLGNKYTRLSMDDLLGSLEPSS